MAPRITAKTTLCISLAARPSNHGVRFHNWLYEKLDLDFVYKAVAPVDIEDAVAGIRGLGIRGAGVSMPYKQAVIPLIDALDTSAERLGAVNTIVNDSGKLTGYNTDYTAVRALLEDNGVDPNLTAAVRGSGGMAAAVVAALADHGHRGTVVARNHSTGTELAHRYGWDYSPRVPEGAQFLVNVTPIGMQGPDESVTKAQAFTDEELDAATVVMDAVALPATTPLVTAARERGLTVITGDAITALQAAEQFELYTGVSIDRDLVDEAEAFAQS